MGDGISGIGGSEMGSREIGPSLGSSYNAMIARMQEIESRLATLDGSPPPTAAPVPMRPAFSSGVASALSSLSAPSLTSAQTPYNVFAAQASGNVRLQATGAGPFSPFIEGLIAKYAGQNGIPTELVRAVVQQESSGNPRDVSHAGAMGLMQLMPEEVQEFGVTNPFDPEQNIAAGTRLLSGLMKQYANSVPLALAAYNAGSGAVKKYGGIPPYKETQGYVKRIMGMLGQQP